MTRLIRYHAAALLLCLLVGAVYASHHFFIPRFLDGSREVYEPLTRTAYFDEAVFYGPRANAAYQGPLAVGDTGVAEYRTVPTPFSLVNPALLGVLGRLLGSVRRAFIASDFIFPAAIFLLVYLIFCKLAVSRSVALTGSAIFLFVPKIGVSLPPLSLAHLGEISHTLFPFLLRTDVLPFTQFEEPKITFLFFTLAFYCVYRALNREEPLMIVAAGVTFGLLFYTYLYDWALFLVALSLLAVWFIARKEYSRAKKIAIVIGIGLLVSVPYWIHLAEVRHAVQARDILARVGGEFSHRFRFATVWKSYLRTAVLAGLLFSTLRKKHLLAAAFISSFLFAYVVAVNAQVVIGFNIQPDHWYRTQFFPITAALVILLFLACQRWRHRVSELVRVGAAACFLGFFLVTALMGQYAYSVARAREYALPLARAKSYAWLNEYTPPGSVVGSISFETTNDVELLTHNRVYLPMFNTAVPSKEVWERFLFLAKIYRVPPERLADTIRNGPTAFFLFMEEYGSRGFDSAFGKYERKVPESIAAEEIRVYKEMARHPLTLPPPHQLDYLYVSDRERVIGEDPAGVFPHLKKIYDRGGIIIYEIIPPIAAGAEKL
ncbi:MAG: hypothetical protein Q8Q94_02995 [bacterium]|nr:hypothetical protein [bacterium]MDZ4299523.1 hypothetical protein [Candidatus Sungbacteria bacterium]